ncbi:hypothetical protein QBC43DRAFT_306583 [Cladorrhinum sp. PSN259]|nr:hypothetical protein QBC43DRAFT_306583 [Cladorrhinum sp. PSN259]
MADPLSIAASVAGLVATTTKICSALSAFVSGAIDAPSSARAALIAVEEMRLALGMVKDLVDTISALPSRRRVLVRLDHIAITFSNCVLTLSELESLVCFRDGILHRLRWAWGEKKVLKLLPRLESQKSSLSLMVSVLTCQSEVEALQGQERLYSAVELILERADSDFTRRLQSLDGRQGLATDDRSVRFYDADSQIDAHRFSIMTQSLGPASFQNECLPSTSASDIRLEALLANPREFERILEQSRVYSRARDSGDSDMSFTSSAVQSHAWSMLSLNDISIVGVFRLPVTLDDINSFGPGLTFAGLLQDQIRAPGGPVSLDMPQDTSHGVPTVSLSTADTTVSQTSGGVTTGAEAHVDLAPGTLGPAPAGDAGDRKRPDVTVIGNIAGSGTSTIKLVAVGDGDSLKQETLVTYRTGKFPREHVPTPLDIYSVTYMIHDEPYTLYLYDTTCLEDHDRFRPVLYPQTDVFLIFALIGSQDSYDNVRELWAPEVRHHCPGVPFLIVGVCSNDEEKILERARTMKQPHTREDYKRMGDFLALQLGAVKYIECNIFTQWHLDDVFDEAILAALEPPRRKKRWQRRSWRAGFLRTVDETEEWRVISGQKI